MAVLVTGGAGYIGSHTDVLLLQAGFDVVVVDNLCNSHPEVFNRIETITGKRPVFIEGDILDSAVLKQVFSDYSIDAVIHFAGLKAVGESVAKPVMYYQNNVAGSINLFDVMAKHGCKRIVFSSSATVYGDPASVPIREDFPLSATNPYGQSKLMIENILRDIALADPEWQISILRYFNPVGAHESGLIGEDPNGIPNNLMPFVAQVAIGRLDKLNVFGGDYPTIDGTGVRDYIHVVDLAAGHLKALDALSATHGCQAYNLGTGNGYSVLEVVNAFAQASGRDVPYQISERRAGDIAACYADPAHSAEALGWSAEFDLERMVTDHWRWQSTNPDGYSE
ncbi:UDP-glucose 4-epimerase GalE [Neptunomonas qingdaonensis]|uniref:UDP-glucose 4-epimerase n=1 Tax=Neptunomonas qingdaonensis TaxID=1045558 RepID=A0A1I2VS41_9GAMM|nr:UDP-glucose 4-epimerase GalE [Neptunomonas qingdaonensis]SFG92058.1 UDP-glucose 4-epimerase [Neptunomonas qingdaonensis]